MDTEIPTVVTTTTTNIQDNKPALKDFVFDLYKQMELINLWGNYGPWIKTAIDNNSNVTTKEWEYIKTFAKNYFRIKFNTTLTDDDLNFFKQTLLSFQKTDFVNIVFVPGDN